MKIFVNASLRISDELSNAELYIRRKEWNRFTPKTGSDLHIVHANTIEVLIDSESLDSKYHNLVDYDGVIRISQELKLPLDTIVKFLELEDCDKYENYLAIVAVLDVYLVAKEKQEREHLEFNARQMEIQRQTKERQAKYDAEQAEKKAKQERIEAKKFEIRRRIFESQVLESAFVSHDPTIMQRYAANYMSKTEFKRLLNNYLFGSEPGQYCICPKCGEDNEVTITEYHDFGLTADEFELLQDMQKIVHPSVTVTPEVDRLYCEKCDESFRIVTYRCEYREEIEGESVRIASRWYQYHA